MDIIIIFDQNKINERLIFNCMYNIHKYLEFNVTNENNNVNYSDLSIHRNNNDLHPGIHRKLTHTDSIIHLISNHPFEHKLAAYNFNINRMITLPITEQTKQQE